MQMKRWAEEDNLKKETKEDKSVMRMMRNKKLLKNRETGEDKIEEDDEFSL